MLGNFQDACSQINKRLAPIKDANRLGTWNDWVKEAYFQRISLAASGFYRLVSFSKIQVIYKT